MKFVNRSNTSNLQKKQAEIEKLNQDLKSLQNTVII